MKKLSVPLRTGAPWALGMLGLAGTSAWAAEVQLKLDIPRLNVAEYHRPYVAVWLEKAGGELLVWTPTAADADHRVTAKGLADVTEHEVDGGRLITATVSAPGDYSLEIGEA